MTTLRRPLAPLLLALTLAACGGGTGPQAGVAPQVDACQLFTEQDAQAIAGDTLAAMSSTLDEAKGRNPLECIYNSGSIDQPRILSLLIRPQRSAAAAKAFLESSRSTLSAMSGGRVQAVSGLGDAALWVGGRIQQLHVAAGALELVVTVQSPDGSDQIDKARRIAALVVERLHAGARRT